MARGASDGSGQSPRFDWLPSVYNKGYSARVRMQNNIRSHCYYWNDSDFDDLCNAVEPQGKMHDACMVHYVDLKPYWLARCLLYRPKSDMCSALPNVC